TSTTVIGWPPDFSMTTSPGFSSMIFPPRMMTRTAR
ncbi:MAG: hypothetical protein ACI9HH_004299, partial [Pseudomonadota bacterium]